MTEQGVYSLSFPEYGEIEALSAHRLMQMTASPRHAQVFRENVESDALKLGKLVHLAVLEPEEFQNRVVRSPKFDRRTTQGKIESARFSELHVGKELVDEVTFEKLSPIQEALAQHPAASRLIARCKAKEQALVWNDRSGVLCKARPDMFSDTICCDLKTIKHGEGGPERFLSSALSYGRLYHWQAAFYLRGFKALQMGIGTWIWIVVETEEPYAVSVVEAHPDIIEYAKQQTGPLIEQYAECTRNGAWPAYSDRVETPEPPQWLRDKLYGG